MLKCHLHDLQPEARVDAFVMKHGINQQHYRLAGIYRERQGFEYRYLVCEDQGEVCGVMPFILYRNALGNVIHSLPYLGYGGIAAREEGKEEIFSRMLAFLMERAQEEKVLLTTICTPPLKEEYRLYREQFRPDFERKNFYQFLDLREDIYARMNSKFRGNLRRNLRKCAGYGVVLEESRSEADLLEWYKGVYLKRLGQTGCAIYPYQLFQGLLVNLEESRVRVVYARLEGRIIGGGFYLNQGVSMDNFMRVVDSEFFHTQAGTMLDAWSIDEAISAGTPFYNWQSCDEIGSSIYKYKEDWGSRVDHHFYLTKITGELEAFRKTPLSVVKKEYAGIYVMPYEEFGS